MSNAQDEYENKQPFEFLDKTSEFIESKPNRIFSLYPNVVENQRDAALKLSNAEVIHNPFDFQLLELKHLIFKKTKTEFKRRSFYLQRH